MTDQSSPPRRRGPSPTETLDSRLRGNDKRAREHDERAPGNDAEETPKTRDRHFEVNCYKILHPTRTPKEFCDRITNILHPMGFCAFSFIALTPTPCFLFDNLPKGLREAYGEENFINDDYALDYGRGSQGPLLRSAIEDHMAAAPLESREMTRNRELSQLFKQHGFYDFFLIPLRSGDNIFLFSVTTQAEHLCDFYDNIDEHTQALTLLGQMILQVGSVKFCDLFLKAPQPRKTVIHPRPLQLLKTLARYDLTLDQAANRLCISIHTADKHMAAARKALDVRTTSGAVYQAFKYGLIEIK